MSIAPPALMSLNSLLAAAARRANPTLTPDQAAKIGSEVLTTVRTTCAGERYYLSAMTRSERQLRHARIRAEYNNGNGQNLQELSRIHRIGPRQLRRILAVAE